METINKKIFLETHQSGYKMRFGDMFNILLDYFEDNSINYEKYHPYTDSKYCEISTFSICAFATLRTFKNPKEQNIAGEYIEKLAQIIEETNYIEENNDYSIVKVIGSFFNEEQTEQNEQLILTDNYTDFKYINSLLYKLFKDEQYRYHTDFIVLLTVGTIAFTSIIKNQANRFEFLSSYLSNLKQLVNSKDFESVYDEPNNRNFIYF